MDALKNIGSIFGGGASGGSGGSGGGGSPWGALLPALMGGFGLYSNIKNSREQQAAQNQIDATRKRYANLSPAQLAGMVRSAEAPLDQATNQIVGNQVFANLAERGLSQAPGIATASLAQGLAPYQQANQAQAMQLVLQQMGYPLEVAKAMMAGNPGSTDLSGPMTMVMDALGGLKKKPGTLDPGGNAPMSRDYGVNPDFGPEPNLLGQGNVPGLGDLGIFNFDTGGVGNPLAGLGF